jgi:manganese oxidase
MESMKRTTRRSIFLAVIILGLAATSVSAQPVCGRTIRADVVALDQAFYANRLGAIQAGGMIFALRRDVVSVDGAALPLAAGKVMLRPDKRPRPMVLRMNVDDCLEIRFQNLLCPLPSVFNGNIGNQRYPVQAAPGTVYTPNQNRLILQDSQAVFDGLASQPAARLAGVHVMGLELVSAESPPGTAVAAVAADGSWVGANDAAAANPALRASGLVAPGERMTYTYVAKAEGAYLLYSTAGNVGLILGFGSQLMQGLFGSVTVQPRTAEWYRSQVTKVDLDLASSGKTMDGHPIIDYDKIYPPKHPRAGQPILKMLDKNNEIVYSDLTAIITGPKHGRFDCASCEGGTCEGCPGLRDNPSYPDRTQPFREFAIHYHDDFVSTQAFAEFRKRADGNDDPMTYTLQGSRDFFAINYGMAGIGAEVWANRIKVGPMHDCATCRFEEFFLSSWAVGDPAMVVDIPANAIDPKTNAIKTGPKATKALYPDDPSNVYHSYMGDHVKFQILHAGTNISHVHHLHAHQWLHTPNDDKSSYRDSQMISPGGSFTLDHTYSGSGNKNKTVGDAIFHCHFYPHFAQGMWSLWRVHDVFEGGTTLDAQQRPVAGFNRALPDGEIAVGTPIPAIVPMPTIPMAPIGARVQIVSVDVPGVPTRAGFRADVDMADPNIKNGPGFPFFIPGVAGQRVPHPPIDFAPDETDAANPFLNGGLPRFIALKEVGTLYEKHNRWDFSKFNDQLKAVRLDEAGTDIEKIAMTYHAQRLHDTFLPDGTPATGASGFVLNGRPPIAGAPYADPAIELDGTPVCPENKPPCLARYKAADIQLDLVFNKKGQHYPQSRMITLWGDVNDTLAGTRAPEPFFFRANSTQVIEYWLANLVPNYYELDDFQVRTPTDILGQHIHLVKFDVTSSDGAGNGFNYEDGSLSPQEVREVIENINNGGGLFTGFDFNAGTATPLTAKSIPYFGAGVDNAWLGAQATIQRWYADPVLSNSGTDRTLRTIFTHDHFGPSTHQQVGLYAGLLVEPAASQWQDPVSGVFLGTNLGRPVGANGQTIDDGGPTSWQANIITSDTNDSFREFALEFQDRQLAYKAGSKSKTQFVDYTRYASPNPPAPAWGWADPLHAINPPLNVGSPEQDAPFPSIVTLAFQTGTYSLNYRNEPVAFRVNPNIGTPTALQTDLSSVFRSIPRADVTLNVQPTGRINSGCVDPGCFRYAPPQFGVEGEDPYTPMLRAYEGDKVQIRTLVGAHMSPHYFTVHGVNWLFEPTLFNASDNTSGYRGTQGMGISEHYEMLFPLPRTNAKNGLSDYFYSSSSDTTGLAAGNWGIMRGYRALQPTGTALVPLPNNTPPANVSTAPPAPPVCPAGAPNRAFNVVAVRARDVMGGPLVYNARGRAGEGGNQQLVNLNALVYFLKEDLDPKTGMLLPGTPVEPLILRANAGDCINITLENRVPTDALNIGSSSLGIPINTSHEVGLHPQLVSFDVTLSNGVNAGKNPPLTITPGNSGGYTWYAGNIEVDAGGNVQHIPVEFGSIPLTPSDPLMQHPFGLLGALIIEPQGTSWRADDNARASATVCSGTSGCTAGNMLFREFVVIVQDDVSSVRQTTGTDGETESTPIPYSRAINYRTEPLDYRFADPAWLENLNINSPLGVGRALSNSLVLADPQTPIFVATANTPLRFRMVHPAGINEQVFTLHGHVWQEEPYVNGSKEIGRNPLSQSQGSRDGFGANVAFDAVIEKAGGAGGVPGDYLFRTFIANVFQNGMWGLLRVAPPTQDVVTITRFSNPKVTKGRVLIAGTTTVDPNTGRMADRVTIFDTTKGGNKELGQAEVDKLSGVWPRNGQPFSAPGTVTSIMVRSAGNGQTVAASYIREVPTVPSAAATRAVAAKKRPTTQRADELELFNATPKRTETFLQAAGQESGQSQWLLNGKPLGADRTVVVRPGDTITISVKEGRHDLTFPDSALARSVFQFGMPGVAFRAKAPALSTGVVEGAGILATLTVRTDLPGAPPRVPFTSTVDGQRMDATFVIGR